MVHHRTQRSGPGGGAGGVYKLERVKLIITGNCIAVDLRGAQIPTPKPRPHIPVLYRQSGYSTARARGEDLMEVDVLADQWMYSRSIGVLSRVVTFSLSKWEEVMSPRNEVIERSRVYGELEQFVEFIRSSYSDRCELKAEDPLYTYVDMYD